MFNATRSTGLLLAFTIAAAACSDIPTATDPQLPASDQAVTLDQMAAEANAAGDGERAATLTSAASAVRLGVRPSDIAVTIAGNIVRYQAIVTGAVETLGGDTALRRTLIAWTPQTGTTTAVLQVSTLSDIGSFLSPSEPASDPRGRAVGIWADLTRPARYIATTGTAAIVLGAIGEPCGSAARGGDSHCHKAEFRVTIDGLFRLDGARPDAGLPAVRIQVNGEVVHGMVR